MSRVQAAHGPNGRSAEARTASQPSSGAGTPRFTVAFKAGLGKCDVASLPLLLVAETRSFSNKMSQRKVP